MSDNNIINNVIFSNVYITFILSLKKKEKEGEEEDTQSK